jgi:hypothetical protein
MATEIDWNSVGGKESKSKVRFIKFASGKLVVFRPIGKGVEFVKFFVKTPSGSRSVCVNPADGEQAAAMLTEHTGQEYTSQPRYATNVIDRADGVLKILEGGSSIFKHFRNWVVANKVHLGHRAGGDWAITADGEGKARRYTTSLVKLSPITEKEEADFKALKTNGWVLDEVYKSVPLEDLIETVFGEKNTSNSTKDAGKTVGGIDDDPIDF